MVGLGCWAPRVRVEGRGAGDCECGVEGGVEAQWVVGFAGRFGVRDWVLVMGETWLRRAGRGERGGLGL